MNATPLYATITYLSSEGHGTLIVNKACPASVGESLDDGEHILAAYLSYPKPGKHVRFNGAWLHGAPALDLPQLYPAGPAASAAAGGRKAKHGRRKRVTLLVNVWPGAKPLHAEALPADLARRLSPCLAKSPFSLGQPTAEVAVAERPQRSGGASRAGKAAAAAAGTVDRGEQDFSFAIAQEQGPGATASSLCMRLPLASISEALSTAGLGASLALRFGYGEASCVDAPA